MPGCLYRPVFALTVPLFCICVAGTVRCANYPGLSCLHSNYRANLKQGALSALHTAFTAFLLLDYRIQDVNDAILSLNVGLDDLCVVYEQSTIPDCQIDRISTSRLSTAAG